jgi:hypothetical protein
MSSNTDTPYQIIKKYLQHDNLLVKELDSINKVIDFNNNNLDLINSKINQSSNLENLMILNIKKNHILILNKNLLNKINKIKNKISFLIRKRFKNIIIIINSLLLNYLKNISRDVNEELLYLYVKAIRSKQYMYIPNVCDDVFNQLVIKLFEIIKNINIDIDIDFRLNKLEGILLQTSPSIYKITYN